MEYARPVGMAVATRAHALRSLWAQFHLVVRQPVGFGRGLGKGWKRLAAQIRATVMGKVPFR